MNLEEGHIINIENKEYICISSKLYNGELYYLLMSNSKPIDIKFSKKVQTDTENQLEIINNIEEKQMLLELFSEVTNY